MEIHSKYVNKMIEDIVNAYSIDGVTGACEVYLLHIEQDDEVKNHYFWGNHSCYKWLVKDQLVEKGIPLMYVERIVRGEKRKS